MRILITGITGAIGGALAPELLRDGHELHALSRDPRNPSLAQLSSRIRLHTGDVVSGAGLEEALDGVQLAYYLIHSMESVPTAGARASSFPARERRGAENFAAAATAAGVRRVIYLGGLLPSGSLSEHLASRLAVEQLLLAALPQSTALRASIVIGAQSRSFRLLVRLVERMPVLLIPDWGRHRTMPVDQRDVVAALRACVDEAAVAGRSLDLVGPDPVTYRELIEHIRDQLLLSRPAVGLPGVRLTALTSTLAAAIASEDAQLVGALMQGLGADLLPSQQLATRALGLRPHRLDAAIERALRDWELTEAIGGR
jgi:uncharacterized protein YbjT (DUF2867 family)